MLSRKELFVAFFLLPIITPICIAYILDPISFDYTWKGRTLYLFFLWLMFLEIILVWDDFVHKNFSAYKGWRMLTLIALALAPSLYVIVTNLRPVSEGIVEFGKVFGVLQDPWFLEVSWPLSLEYLALTVFFTLLIWFTYKKNGLRYFALSLLLLGATGTVYMIDTLYPFGAFTPFQSFVPFTALAADQILKWMGYDTSLTFQIHPLSGVELPVIEVIGTGAKFGIGWPCAGVQSLFIYTFTVLLLLRRMGTQTILKIVYFVVGAFGTYIVNILRVVSIFLVAIHQGEIAATTFHDFYGEFYAMTWIVLYLAIVIVIHKKGDKLKRAIVSPRMR